MIDALITNNPVFMGCIRTVKIDDPIHTFGLCGCHCLVFIADKLITFEHTLFGDWFIKRYIECNHMYIFSPGEWSVKNGSYTHRVKRKEIHEAYPRAIPVPYSELLISGKKLQGVVHWDGDKLMHDGIIIYDRTEARG